MWSIILNGCKHVWKTFKHRLLRMLQCFQRACICLVEVKPLPMYTFILHIYCNLIQFSCIIMNTVCVLHVMYYSSHGNYVSKCWKPKLISDQNDPLYDNTDTRHSLVHILIHSQDSSSSKMISLSSHNEKWRHLHIDLLCIRTKFIFIGHVFIALIPHSYFKKMIHLLFREDVWRPPPWL